MGDGDQMQLDDTPVPSFVVDPPESTQEVPEEDEDIPTTTIMIVKEEELEGWFQMHNHRLYLLDFRHEKWLSANNINPSVQSST